MSLFSYPCTRIVVQTSSCLARSHFLRKQLTFPSETRHFWFMNAIKKNIDAYFMLYKTLVIAYDHDANCRFQDFVDFEIFHSEHHRRCHSVLYTWHTIICTPGIVSLLFTVRLAYQYYIRKSWINLVCFIKTRLPTYQNCFISANRHVQFVKTDYVVLLHPEFCLINN